MVDSETDAGIAGAKVQLDTRYIYCENDGSFFIGQVSGGTYTVSVSADGYLTATHVVNVPVGGFVGRDFSLQAEIKPPEGEGEAPAEGEGEIPAEGEGEAPVEGEGEVLPEGEGEAPVEGEPEGEDDGCCAGCGSSGDAKADFQRYLGDYLLIGLSLLGLMTLTTKLKR